MIVQERQFEGKTHYEIEDIRIWNQLGLHHFILATFAHAVVARIELERRSGIFDDVFVDEYTCFQVGQFIFTFVLFENFCWYSFISS